MCVYIYIYEYVCIVRRLARLGVRTNRVVTEVRERFAGARVGEAVSTSNGVGKKYRINNNNDSNSKSNYTCNTSNSSNGNSNDHNTTNNNHMLFTNNDVTSSNSINGSNGGLASQAGGREQRRADLQPMKSEPPTPSRAPDNQFRNMYMN